MAREQRQFAAIVAADVVRFSRLVGRDESGTVAHRQRRLEPARGRHVGCLVKLTGDGNRMGRRELAAVFGLALLSRPAMAQEAGHTYRLGFVVQPQRSVFAALFDELRRQGFVEGRNLSVDPDGFGLASEDLEAAAVRVAKRRPDAIYSGGTAANRAVKQATTTIPVVVTSDDIVGDHIVESLARPGGNITGISILATELDAKRLSLLIDLVPGIHHVGVLFDPATTPADHLPKLAAMAHALGVDLSMHGAASHLAIGSALEAARAAGAQALTVLTSALFHAHRMLLIELIRQARLPAMYQWPEYCAEGALIGYGPSFTAMYRQAAKLLAKVMRGAPTADMPAEQPTKFELIINLKTAKELNLAVPSALLVSADEVIE